MRTALKMNVPMEIKTNGRSKILVNGEEVALSDITAIRYDFGKEAGDCGFLRLTEAGTYEFNEAASIIAANRKTITKSLHLIELNVVEADMAALVSGIRQICGKVAVFLYIDFDGYTDKFQRSIELAVPAFGLVDRVMLRERTSETLKHEDIKKLKQYAEEKFGVRKSDKIGLCDSPVGCNIGMSCLSAITCRELAAKYGDNIDMVVPSQNHEGMNNNGERACNCIGFTVVTSLGVLDAVNIARKSSSSQSGENGEAGQKKKSAFGKKVVLKW